MSEPASTAGVVVAGAAGVSVAAVLASVNGDAAVGALFGSLIYFTTTRELPVWQRALFFVASLVMGYKLAPALVEATFLGVQPFRWPVFGGFVCSALVVTVTLKAIKRRDSPVDPGEQGGLDGQ
ncbi:putative holin [Pseudomonas kuykendallii]|uniref:putative holin n=1 Tax=Pseudomonas kuykendallii TaxID=1007099 RepID=UPI0028D0056D|nr:putative holin [Pseudomonas kuykendallii]